MKKEVKIAIGVIGLIGIYFLYDKVLKNKKTNIKKEAHEYSDGKSCLESGYSWGGRGIAPVCYDKSKEERDKTLLK